MRIAIAAERADLNAQVSRRFGTAQYLIIVDLDSMAAEAEPNPGAAGQKGAGIQAIVLAISKDVKAVLTGSCSPTARRHLEENGIEVVTDISGTVADAVEGYRISKSKEHAFARIADESMLAKIDRTVAADAIGKSARQFANMLPILAAVVLLVGLFNTFVTKGMLSSVFSGNVVLDTIWGACFGSILAGNPINSYVIGAGLSDLDVSMFAVTALILTWVMVGWLQLPAEMDALGKRFALVRNGLCLVLSMPTAMLVVSILHLVEGWIS